MRVLVFLTSMILASTGLAGYQLTADEKLSDFEQLNAQIDANYGPKIYKQQIIHLDFSRLREDYRQRIRNSATNAEFYYLLVEYVAEHKDGHFGAKLPTDYVVSIPVTTDLVDGKVLIDTVDRSKLSTEAFRFERGDEIVAVDGQPAADLVSQLAKYVGNGYELSARRIAAQAVFFRRALLFPAPEGKEVTISVRKGLVVETVKLEWKTTGTALDEIIPKTVPKSLRRGRAHYDQLSSVDAVESVIGRERLERSYQCSGQTRIAIPKDATILMKEPFVAYYHPTAKGNVGYLRIPHYTPDPKPGTTIRQYEVFFRKYEWAVSELEKNTVGLIIDQDHNCGGSIEYMHQLISLFAVKPFKPMQFELRASKSEYLGYVKSLKEEVIANSIDEKRGQKVADLILNSWKDNRYLTPQTSIGGADFVQPNFVHYTKPILILIDEMSGSGGDGFPAMMQGIGRATLFGTRTMGLGGHVENMPALWNSGINVRMTKSLFYRPDGVPVENNGAHPDIPYTITRDDFVDQYRGYQAAYLKALLEKIP